MSNLIHGSFQILAPYCYRAEDSEKDDILCRKEISPKSRFQDRMGICPNAGREMLAGFQEPFRPFSLCLNGNSI